MSDSAFAAYRPLTFTVGFLEASLDTVADAVGRWRKEHHKVVDLSRVDCSLAEALPLLEPLTTPYRREFYCETRSGWTARFDNRLRGADPFGPIAYMSEQRLHCRGLIASYIPQTKRNSDRPEVEIPKSIRFALLAPEPREWLNFERSISIIYDNGRWQFETTGTVQPFEDTERYKARRIVDRFTADMLDDYCRALGIQWQDEDFYGPSGVLINVGDPLPERCPEFTLEEAQRKLGIS